MMSRTQIMLDSEVHRRALRRASDLGLSLAEYICRLVVRDVATPEVKADVTCVFDLGRSGGSDIARNRDAMIGTAFRSTTKDACAARTRKLTP
jgi:hypothetical protein